VTLTDRELRSIAVDVLTERQFECWELSRFHHRSYRVISLMLDIEKSTVQGHVRRADQKLDRWLRDNEGRGDVSASSVRSRPNGDRAGQGLAA
jgi:DNA-binding CsgD family transcriptional regulator